MLSVVSPFLLSMFWFGSVPNNVHYTPSFYRLSHLLHIIISPDMAAPYETVTAFQIKTHVMPGNINCTFSLQ